MRLAFLIPCSLTLQRELQQLTDTSGASGHQKLRVCDVCGAYLSVLDSDRRLADHFGGKVGDPTIWLRSVLISGNFVQMHLGYHELRNMLGKFREERDKRKMGPPSTAGGPPGAAAAGPPPRSGSSGGDYRSSRGEEYRDRDRGYDSRSGGRHE
jgi:LUC7 N_terminus